MVGSSALPKGDPTMFKQLFQRETVVRRGRAAPLARPRRHYLEHCAERGRARSGRHPRWRASSCWSAWDPTYHGDAPVAGGGGREPDSGPSAATPCCRRPTATPRSISRPRRRLSPGATKASPRRPSDGATGRNPCSASAPCGIEPLCGAEPGRALARQGLAPPSSHNGAMHICQKM